MATGDKLRDINPQDCFVTTAAGAIVGVQAGADASTAARFLNEAQVTAILAGGGGGGAPGGSTTQLQYNNAGAFGGMSTYTFDSGSASMVKTMDNAGNGGTLWKTASTLNAASPGYSQQWREGTFSTPFTYTDFVMNIGYNWSGSARNDAAFPAQFLQLEAAYQLNNSALASQKVTEMHWNHVDVTGRVRRPINFVGAWDGEFLQVGLSGSQFTLSDLAANDRLVGYFVDGETTLNGAINNSTATVILTKARAVSNGQYITVKAEGANTTETMLVTAGAGTTTLTVTRAQSTTSASAHATGAIVLLPAANLVLNSSLNIYTDAASSLILANAAGTINWLVVNSGGTTLATTLSVTAAVQNLAIFKNSASSGNAAIQLKPDNGNKTMSFTADSAGNLVINAGIGSAGALFLQCGTGGHIWRNNGYASIMNLSDVGDLGIGITATAKIHIKAGAAAAGGAPLKLTSGTNLTTAENGAFEFDGTNLYFTTGGTRKTVTLV